MVRTKQISTSTSLKMLPATFPKKRKVQEGDFACVKFKEKKKVIVDVIPVNWIEEVGDGSYTLSWPNVKAPGEVEFYRQNCLLPQKVFKFKVLKAYCSNVTYDYAVGICKKEHARRNNTGTETDKSLNISVNKKMKDSASIFQCSDYTERM